MGLLLPLDRDIDIVPKPLLFHAMPPFQIIYIRARFITVKHT
jgi:hypothetical protein